MCLAEGHNTVTPVSLQPMAPQSRVKHSTRLAEARYNLNKRMWPDQSPNPLPILEVHRSQITRPTRY